MGSNDRLPKDSDPWSEYRHRATMWRRPVLKDAPFIPEDGLLAIHDEPVMVEEVYSHTLEELQRMIGSRYSSTEPSYRNDPTYTARPAAPRDPYQPARKVITAAEANAWLATLPPLEPS